MDFDLKSPSPNTYCSWLMLEKLAALFLFLVSVFTKALLLWMSSITEFWREEGNMPRKWASMCCTITLYILISHIYILLVFFMHLHSKIIPIDWKPVTEILVFSPRDDLMRAIKKLKVMGNGFGMIPVGGSYLVQSVPAELNMDHTVVLQLAEVRQSFIWPYFVSP